MVLYDSLPRPRRSITSAAARADRCDSSFRTGSNSASRAAAAAAFFAARLLTEEPSFLPRAYGSKAAPAAARVSAASALLDRGWGRPAQPHTGEDDKDIQVTIRNIVEPRR